MITYYPYQHLGHHKLDWLDTRYHFSFSQYYNPNRMGFGVLRVINDDRIHAGQGFDPHPHRDMEIITYVRKGAITHKDNQGNVGKTAAGDVQVMSAGTGIVHSEYNAEAEDTVLFQIWILPHTLRVKPRWEQAVFPKAFQQDNLKLLVSGYEEDKASGALWIHQYATIHGGRIQKGTTLTHTIRHQAYMVVSEGLVEVDGQSMQAGDGAEITGVKQVRIAANEDSELLIIDVPEA